MKNSSPHRNADIIEDEDEAPIDPRQGMMIWLCITALEIYLLRFSFER